MAGSVGPSLSLRDIAKQMAKKFPKTMQTAARRADEYARGMLTGGTLFEELGFYYVGPVDGHDLNTMVPILQNVRDAKQLGPVLVHVVTEKGKGHPVFKTRQGKLPRHLRALILKPWSSSTQQPMRRPTPVFLPRH